ncbi:glycosyltransferase [Marisediminicola sp. LYQ134]|uniref:glycosyltransferase n=1 Tax=Marisediminicola sp. LYQ134 TaxID=3391061 RepID=UPI0039830C03
MPELRPGVVSVVLVNYRGADDTIEAIRTLGELEWPSELLEIVVVENASGDDSAERIRAAAPHVTLIVSKTNTGFAGGCNLGVASSSGEFIALLNNDAKPDAAWVSAAVAKFGESPRIGAVASRVLDWDGELVDYIGSAMTWYGMGFKPWTAQAIPKRVDDPTDVLFGTGSAMFVRRSVFDELGGFDERYFMFFEDVDLGWRLNLRGWRYAYAPASLAYHKHHASMSSFGAHKETYLLERNALFTLYKNLGDESLTEILPAAMALSVRRGISQGAVDSEQFELRSPGANEPETTIASTTLAPLFAIDRFVEELPSLRTDRERIQATRVVPENRIWRLFGHADAPVYQEESYLRGYENLVTTFNVTEPPATRNVLIITGDPLGDKMAGPAIRAWNMAVALADDNAVTVVTLSGAEPLDAPFDIAHVRAGDDRAFAPYEKWADVIIFQGHAMAVFSALRSTSKIVVVDIYDPMHLEQLEQGRELPAATWAKQVDDATDVLNEQLARGDFFLCASERQRHFYLGQLAALGRINPANYADDPDLDGLIAVAPFGMTSTPPRHEKTVLKGVKPGIGADDKVLLWGGGLYNWFDPKTLIRAVAKVSETHGDVRLFFQGTKHPHPGVPEMAIVAESRRLAAELGALDTSVFFNDSWVDYTDRQNYLTEADAGVSTHFSHVETTFSFRTRILDYLWAELPMVVTEGDSFAELVATEKLGIVVPSGDVDALAAALDRILFDEKFIATSRRNIRRVRTRFFWEETLRPLTDFMAQPAHAGDRQGVVGASGRATDSAAMRRRQRPHGIRHDVQLAAHYLKHGGISTVARKVGSRLKRLRGR